MELDNIKNIKDVSMSCTPVSVVVVIPYYNGSDFIERSARSVLEQTVVPQEFIVVDDGSTAEEAQKLDDVAARMGFRVLHKENGGQGSARNAGVAATTSDFICFLDQDDFYLRNHIEILIGALPNKDPHFGWVYGDLLEADRNAQIVRTGIASHYSRHPKISIFDMIGADMHVLPSASMIGRKAFEAVGGFDNQFTGYEDDDLFLRIFRSGFTNHFVDKAVTVWCIHPGSTSYSIRMARSRFKYLKKLSEMFPDEPELNRFYMRDYLIPRFYKPIIADAVKAASRSSDMSAQSKDEYLSFANELRSLVEMSPYVSRRMKFRANITIFLINKKWISAFVMLKPIAVFVYLRLRRIVGLR